MWQCKKCQEFPGEVFYICFIKSITTMDNQKPNPEDIFKAMIMFAIALKFESQAFQEFKTERIRARVCLN
jgi:hypothetical protein